MKNLVLLVSMTTLIAHASEQELWPTESSFSWSGEKTFSNPTAEIRNREKYPVKVTIIQDNKQQTFSLGANKSSFFETKVPVMRVRNLNPSQEFRIEVAYETPRKPGFNLFKNYTIPAGKKAFVSWENDALRPQRGKSGKTQSGISLKKNNNVTKEELDSAVASNEQPEVVE